MDGGGSSERQKIYGFTLYENSAAIIKHEKGMYIYHLKKENLHVLP